VKKSGIIITIIFFILVFNIIPFSTVAQESSEGSAEINAIVTDDVIPPVKINEWTSINISIEDVFGIDWDRLRSVIPEWYMRLVWHFNPLFPQPIERFLGHTGIRVDPPEIIRGDAKGWFFEIYPTAIHATNPGNIHPLTLRAKVDDIAIDYAVVVGITFTRLDTLGGEIGSTTIKIPLKASNLNLIRVSDIGEHTKHAGHRSIVYFQTEVVNEGYYKDAFQFKIEAENGLMALVQQQSIVLEPGERRQITIEVLTPEKLYDVGTANKIDLYAFSSSDPNEKLIGSFIVITEGIYISPLIGIILIPIIIILLCIYFIFFYLKQKKEKELFGRPEKPWNIPTERKHLEELKRKDKEAYEKERIMMEDEYKTALLWYGDHRQSIRQEKQKGITKQFYSKVTGFFKKSENNQKKTEEEKPITKQKDKTENGIVKFFSKSEKKEKQPKKEKKPVKKIKKPIQKEEKPKETPEIIKEQYKAIKKRSAESERKKQIALEKIKRAQEKQKKKMK